MKSYEDCSSGAENSAVSLPVHSIPDWSNGLTRRACQKKTGGATAATMLTLHGMNVVLLADGGSISSDCRLLPTAAYFRGGESCAGVGVGPSKAQALEEAMRFLHIDTSTGGNDSICSYSEKSRLCEPITYDGTVTPGNGVIISYHDNGNGTWNAHVTLEEGDILAMALYSGIECEAVGPSGYVDGLGNYHPSIIPLE